MCLCVFTALSENLQEDTPLGVDILGSRVVLFREGKDIKCLDDACPHRCALLHARPCHRG